MRHNETVLVTAAAGGTGQFAVQVGGPCSYELAWACLARSALRCLPCSARPATLGWCDLESCMMPQSWLCTAPAQLAKLAGNHVVATCSSPDKVALLKQLGADRVINYRQGALQNASHPTGSRPGCCHPVAVPEGMLWQNRTCCWQRAAVPWPPGPPVLPAREPGGPACTPPTAR